jgi:NAD(P)-dependent dehydrogenase (short-subunit alcohol dehydrogenase family)
MTSATTAVSAQREPELAGQAVVVIGGSAGIGLETARRARAEGADVILTGRHPDRLQQAAAELGAQRTHRGRLRRHPLSASLLGDRLQERRTGRMKRRLSLTADSV